MLTKANVLLEKLYYQSTEELYTILFIFLNNCEIILISVYLTIFRVVYKERRRKGKVIISIFLM